jgi:hypothetical protein
MMRARERKVWSFRLVLVYLCFMEKTVLFEDTQRVIDFPQPAEIRSAIMTIAEEMQQRSRVEGRVEGRAEGLTIAILVAVRLRFGPRAAELAESHLADVTSHSSLDGILAAVVTAASWDEVEESSLTQLR